MNTGINRHFPLLLRVRMFVLVLFLAKAMRVYASDAPTVTEIFNVGTDRVEIVFSTFLETAGATDLANFVFDNGLELSSATLEADQKTVTLTTAPLVFGSNYTVIINGLQDSAEPTNLIATDTPATFIARPYAPQDIGQLPVMSTNFWISNGMQITVTSGEIAGTNDQFSFQYRLCTGDFDVCTRVSSLSAYDILAKAGLMARETLRPESPFAAALATPAMLGSFFEYRDQSGGPVSFGNNFPANYPNTWLRLKRVGNTFTGFASYDGLIWTELSSFNLFITNQIYLGFAVSSYCTNQSATAVFLDVTEVVTNTTVGISTNPREPSGPSSRKTPVAISEIMYKPAPRSDGKNLEFIELYNSNPWFQDIGGYQLTCADMNYKFPSGTIISPGGYLVVAAAPADISAIYGISHVLGPYAGSLKKSETLQLLDEQGAVLLTVPYSNLSPWPVAAGGTGHSIVLAHATYGEADPRAWEISSAIGGSPGQMESFRPSPLDAVVINEVLAHSEEQNVPQFIELYNHSTGSVDISGCILTDDPATNKFLLPPGTLIGPGGFLSFYSAPNGIALNGAGGTIYFIKPDGSGILDALQFSAQADGTSFGRWPDGTKDLYVLSSPTPGTNNSTILIGDIVINELMYDPISGDDDDQFIELYNQGTNTVNLSGWQFTSGVTYTFPANSQLIANQYLVVARNPARLISHYPNLNNGNTLGSYSGKLAHNGERLVLARPATFFGTNIIYVTEDEVTYGTGGRWGRWSSGGGSSLELINPRANHRLACNWGDSDDTAKSIWTNLQSTAVLTQGVNFDPSVDFAQIGLLDVGECLVDNIEVTSGETNYISNPGFESGLDEWQFQGCMVGSTLENSGYNSGHALHIRCSDRIWTGDNSCEASLMPNPLGDGQTATLRLAARWLHGRPEILMRLSGNWLEMAGTLPVPNNLGTPGMPNSIYTTNNGPAIYQVTHTPALPLPDKPVVVTASANGPNGLKTLLLCYRIDPNTNYATVVMKDDGAGGDAIPGDGIFSATIPGQSQNTLVAFYLAGTNGVGAAARFPELLDDNSAPRECLIFFGQYSFSPFGAYHLWITQSNVDRWSGLGNLSNEGNDCTFVCNGRVIYNAQGRFVGSPFHQVFDTPVGNPCHYNIEFADDDLWLGEKEINKLQQIGNAPGDDLSLQREQLANTFLRTLGVPWLYKRYVTVLVNGNQRGWVMEDTQIPSHETVQEYYPNDDNGFLFKMQPWFEFAPGLSGLTMAFTDGFSCTLNDYSDEQGIKNTARYRYNYEIRRTPDSMSNFTNVFSLVDAANSYGTDGFERRLEYVANMENWMRVFAANHAAGNWDCFGALTGQNLYGYVGLQGTKYSLLMRDFNVVFGNSGSWDPGEGLLQVNPDDSALVQIYNTPAFGRMYWRALQELVNGPLDLSNSGPLIDAKYNIFTASGFTVENPDANLKPWLAQAQGSISAQLAEVNTTSFTVLSTAIDTNSDTVTIGGTAPVNAQTVSLNGAVYPVTWTTLTSWLITAPLVAGTNYFNVLGSDVRGQPISGYSDSVSVVYQSAALPDTSPKLSVVRVGDDGQTLNNRGNSVFIDFFATNGVLINSVSVPTSGPNALLISGTAASEGALSRSSDGRLLIFAGYNIALSNAPASSLANSTSASVPRALGAVDVSGAFSLVGVTSNQFSANNIRAGATDGLGNYWGAGANSGTFYFGNDIPTAIQSVVVNTAAIEPVNGNLFFSTSKTTPGVWKISEMPVSGTTTPTVVLNSGSSGSPFAFAFNPNLTLAYVADDTTKGQGGIQRWDFSGGSWSRTYSFNGVTNVGARGVAVDFSGAQPVIYATTAEASANRLISITDSGAASTISTLATAGANKLFRGITFAPQGNVSPQFLRITKTLNNVNLTCATLANRTYALQYVNDLSDTNWLTLTNVISKTPVSYLMDSAPPAHRFYRLVLFP